MLFSPSFSYLWIVDFNTGWFLLYTDGTIIIRHYAPCQILLWNLAIMQYTISPGCHGNCQDVPWVTSACKDVLTFLPPPFSPPSLHRSLLWLMFAHFLLPFLFKTAAVVQRAQFPFFFSLLSHGCKERKKKKRCFSVTFSFALAGNGAPTFCCMSCKAVRSLIRGDGAL